jgi:hypothetical protein
MSNATAWLDGFIVDSFRGYSFYGMIQPESLGGVDKIIDG